jgi:hypothetical protein
VSDRRSPPKTGLGLRCRVRRYQLSGSRDDELKDRRRVRNGLIVSKQNRHLSYRIVTFETARVRFLMRIKRKTRAT